MNKDCSILWAALGVWAACSIKTPEITLTGEKTALESQILGAYEQLSTQNQLTTSVRTDDNSASNALSEQQETVSKAMQDQKFNKDEIDEFKRDKVIGENNTGYLEILGGTKYDEDPVFKRIVTQITAEENRDRRIIYQRLLAVNASVATSKEGEPGAIFAKMQVEKSAPGTMIQLENGQWIEKPKEKK
jgi:uncharacterized protein YdbL (DUF1318 family)